MKLTVLFSCLTLLTVFNTACGTTKREVASTTVTAADQTPAGSSMNGFVEDKMKFKIKGMTCQNCATKVEKAIKAVPGVATAAVSYKTGEAVVTSSGPSKLDRKVVVTAIESTGYKVQE